MVKKILFTAAMAIPFQNLEGWTSLSFRKIPSNQVQELQGQLRIQVDSSASPLIFKLKEPKIVQGFQWDLEIDGEMKESGASDFEEDSYFRLGLVAVGKRTLGKLERLVAAEWVIRLFELAPPNIGLDRIYFFNLGQNAKLLGKSRTHPKSDLMHETVVAIRQGPLSSIRHDLSGPLKISALWISVDGDDTKSKYQTRIKKLALTISPEEIP